MNVTETERVEHHIQSYIKNKLARDHAIEAMEFSKDQIVEYFKNNEDSTLRVPFDQAFDIKATYGESRTKKVDLDKLADDMNVERKTVNRDFLLKSVDDRKLSFEKFTSYYYDEPSERVSIRLVKAEGN